MISLFSCDYRITNSPKDTYKFLIITIVYNFKYFLHETNIFISTHYLQFDQTNYVKLDFQQILSSDGEDFNCVSTSTAPLVRHVPFSDLNLDSNIIVNQLLI